MTAGRSDVRKSLGVRFDGDTNVTQQLLCGDVEVDGLAPDAWHQWFTGEHLTLLCPLPGTRSWQFQASSPVDADGRLEEPSLEGFQRIVDERTGLPIRLHSPTWLSTYRANVRMVERFRVGRVLLAGDAAHVHPIAGGLGMNTGIQDAYNLGWKLGLVLAGTAGDTLLDTYEAERLPIAAWTLNTSSYSARAMLDAARKGSGGIDAGLTVDTRQLGLHYRWSPLARDLIDRGDRLRAGDRAPDAPVQLAATGAPTRLFDVFRSPHLTVLGFGDECAGVLDELAGAGGAVRTCLVSPSGGHAFRAYEVAAGTLVVVRPDGYLGLTAAAFDAGAVRDYLKGLVVQPSN